MYKSRAALITASTLLIVSCSSVFSSRPTPESLSETQRPLPLIATITAVPTITPVNDPDRLESLYFLFTRWNGSSIEMIELDSGRHSILHQDTRPIKIQGFHHSECAILIGPTQLSPTGWIFMNPFTGIDIGFDIPEWRTADNDQGFVSLQLPPNGNHAAISLGYFSENQERDFDLFDLYIVDLKTAGQSLVLANMGGAEAYAWSPDGAEIAFSEFDDNGFRQAFIADYNGGNLRQITQFRIPNLHVAQLSWSPNGDLIAISYYPAKIEEFTGGGLVVLNSDAKNPPLVNLAFMENQSISKVYGMWWIDSKTILTHISIKDPGPYQSGIYALNVEDSSYREYFGQGQNLGEVVPFENLVLVVSSEIFVYDTQTGQILAQVPRPDDLDIIGQIAVIRAERQGCIYYSGKN